MRKFDDSMRPTITCDFGVVVGCEDAADRPGGLDHLGGGVLRVADRVQQVRHHRAELVAGEVDGAGDVVGDHVAQHAERADVRRAARGLERLVLGCGRLEVEQVGRELHGADAVGDHVVRLHHERGRPSAQPLDER